MCQAPLTIWIGKGGDARQVQTACHECWQCRSNTVLDWVGRNIAESKTAKACHAVTLTYGRDARYGSVDHVRAAILTYSDVQKWLKLLRRHGYPVRYFVTGEWGGKKGRSHWHVMLYWQDKVPDLQVNKKLVVQNYWDDGFSFYTEPNYKQIWYNCKYILKGQGELDQRVLPRMSKKPPLGAEYFERLAHQYAAQGLAPRSLEYTFPEVVRRSSGDLYRFRLGGRSAELFLDAFIAAWPLVQGDTPRPKSQLVDDYEEWGRVISPDTFDYRPQSLGGAALRPDPRGPVEPPSQARIDRSIAAMRLQDEQEAIEADRNYRKYARTAEGHPLHYVEGGGVAPSLHGVKPLLDEKGHPLWVLLEDWVPWREEITEPRQPALPQSREENRRLSRRRPSR